MGAVQRACGGTIRFDFRHTIVRLAEREARPRSHWRTADCDRAIGGMHAGHHREFDGREVSWSSPAPFDARGVVAQRPKVTFESGARQLVEKGSSASIRARAMASTNMRWCHAHVPVCRRGRIFPRSETKLRRI